jgi:hypothetical protein
MPKVIDLSAFIQEGLQFIDPYDKNIIYNIPGEISTKLYLKMLDYMQKINDIKDEKESLEFTQQIVTDILSLDKEKNIDINYVKQRFDNVLFLQIIIRETLKHIQSILQNENFKSPESAQNTK